MRGEWSCCGKQFDECNTGQDEHCAQEGTPAEMLVQNEVGGQAGEHGFKGEENGGVGGREVALGPALDGERSSGGEEAGNGESDDEAGSDGQMRSSAQWQGDGHDKCSYADLEGG